MSLLRMADLLRAGSVQRFLCVSCRLSGSLLFIPDASAAALGIFRETAFRLRKYPLSASTLLLSIRCSRPHTLPESERRTSYPLILTVPKPTLHFHAASQRSISFCGSHTKHIPLSATGSVSEIISARYKSKIKKMTKGIEPVVRLYT